MTCLFNANLWSCEVFLACFSPDIVVVTPRILRFNYFFCLFLRDFDRIGIFLKIFFLNCVGGGTVEITSICSPPPFKMRIQFSCVHWVYHGKESAACRTPPRLAWADTSSWHWWITSLLFWQLGAKLPKYGCRDRFARIKKWCATQWRSGLF